MNECDVKHAWLLRAATNASVIVSVLLVIAKAWAWREGGSVAMLSSLADSIFDVFASALTWLAVRYALVPADHNHRFGHGKAEDLAALFQSLFIGASSVWICIEGFQRLRSPEPITAEGLSYAVMAFSIFCTLLLIGFQRYVYQKTHSPAIQSDFLHYAGDVLVNLAVIAALVGHSFGLNILDPIFGLLIAGYLLFGSSSLGYKAFHNLMDHELEEFTQQEIVRIATNQPEVKGVHALKTRRSGSRTFVQFHLELDDMIPLIRAHAICDEVELALEKEFPFMNVTIHAEPMAVAAQVGHDKV